MTLALANRVGGWDADVIAEDYHMFIKCFCCDYHEQLLATKHSVQSVPKMRLQPVFLPVISYLVEDPRGTFASIVAWYLVEKTPFS